MQAPQNHLTSTAGNAGAPHKLRWRTWLPPLIWIAMIAGGGSSSLSASHTYVWLERLLGFLHLDRATLAWVNLAIRKTGHFCVYGFLSLLLFRSWRDTLSFKSKPAWSWRAAVLAVAGSALVAALDEFHQRFSPGRTSSPRDVALDTFGAIFVQLMVLLVLVDRSRS